MPYHAKLEVNIKRDFCLVSITHVLLIKSAVVAFNGHKRCYSHIFFALQLRQTADLNHA